MVTPCAFPRTIRVEMSGSNFISPPCCVYWTAVCLGSHVSVCSNLWPWLVTVLTPERQHLKGNQAHLLLMPFSLKRLRPVPLTLRLYWSSIYSLSSWFSISDIKGFPQETFSLPLFISGLFTLFVHTHSLSHPIKDAFSKQRSPLPPTTLFMVCHIWF